MWTAMCSRLQNIRMCSRPSHICANHGQPCIIKKPANTKLVWPLSVCQKSLMRRIASQNSRCAATGRKPNPSFPATCALEMTLLTQGSVRIPKEGVRALACFRSSSVEKAQRSGFFGNLKPANTKLVWPVFYPLAAPLATSISLRPAPCCGMIHLLFHLF